MKLFMIKLTVCLFCSLTFATIHYFYPKDHRGFTPGPKVEIFSSKGIVTKAGK